MARKEIRVCDKCGAEASHTVSAKGHSYTDAAGTSDFYIGVVDLCGTHAAALIHVLFEMLPVLDREKVIEEFGGRVTP